MFAKSTILLGLFAISAQVASAGTPACLYFAMNSADSISDIKTLCGSSMKDTITDKCGDQAKDAMSAFTTMCKGVSGNSNNSTSSSTSSSATSSPKSTGTGSGYAKPTGTGAISYTTTTYFDQSCSCTKTGVVAPTGTGILPVPANNGTAPTAPTAPASPASPGSASASPAAGSPTGAASSNGVVTKPLAGSFGAAAVLIAGIAFAL